MQRKTALVTAAAALALTPVAAHAQDYRASGFDAPVGTSATVNLRLSLGGRAQKKGPTLGLTLGYGRMVGASALDAPPAVRQFRLADLRFGRSGLRRAELATFDLLNLDADRRLGFLGDSDGGDNDTLKYIIVGVLAAGAGVLVEELLDKSSEDSPDDSDSPTSPGIG